MGKLTKRKNARKQLIQSLYEWHMSQNDITDIMAFTLTRRKDKIDHEYYQELLSKIVAEVDIIDELISPFTSRNINEVDPIELAILRLSCFELLHRLDLPYKVVINEALDNAKLFGATESHKFVNGVLDKLASKLRSLEQGRA